VPLNCHVAWARCRPDQRTDWLRSVWRVASCSANQNYQSHLVERDAYLAALYKLYLVAEVAVIGPPLEGVHAVDQGSSSSYPSDLRDGRRRAHFQSLAGQCLASLLDACFIVMNSNQTLEYDVRSKDDSGSCFPNRHGLRWHPVVRRFC